MERRELLKMIAAATGVAMVGSTSLLAGCTRDSITTTATTTTTASAGLSFSADDLALLTDISETIMPRTDTPGATDAEVVPFMIKLVDNTYTDEQQQTFHNGLVVFRARCDERHGTDFASLDPAQRTALLADLDAEARNQAASTEAGPHYFTMIKQLTLFAYFTSELVQTQVLRHVPTPGRYDGCYPYREGETAWAI